ncbi:hypothetical protein DL98DRAFT_589079 [Cadophora sp. DSE1049]|nr:hypothetical protein DL98DRAFT_589079 [Cadophora sp. DSE1049]
MVGGALFPPPSHLSLKESQLVLMLLFHQAAVFKQEHEWSSWCPTSSVSSRIPATDSDSTQVHEENVGLNEEDSPLEGSWWLRQVDLVLCLSKHYPSALSGCAIRSAPQPASESTQVHEEDVELDEGCPGSREPEWQAMYAAIFKSLGRWSLQTKKSDTPVRRGA